MYSRESSWTIRSCLELQRWESFFRDERVRERRGDCGIVWEKIKKKRREKRRGEGRGEVLCG